MKNIPMRTFRLRKLEQTVLEIIDFVLLMIRCRSQLQAFDRWLFRSNSALKALEEQRCSLSPSHSASRPALLLRRNRGLALSVSCK